MSRTVRSSAVLPLEVQIAEVVRDLLAEQGKERLAQTVTPKSSFQKDLGLTSLDLVELLVRCEARLELDVPDEVAEVADTPLGWAKAIREGADTAAARSAYRIVPPTGEPVEVPHHARDLTEVLHWHADRAHGRVHVNLLSKGSGRAITCDDLADKATRVARGLIALGLCRNDTVALLLTTGEEFFHALYGVILSGGVAVPIYPPADLSRISEYVERQIHLLRGAGIRFLISFPEARPVERLLRVNLPSLIEVATVAELRDLGARTSARLPRPSELALIQYTSGTTAEPRGAMLTHEGVLSNIRAIGQAVQVGPRDAVVSWLPLASDLGLVGCWLFSLYHATPLTLLPTEEFLERPECWLWAIHDSRGTLSAAPNFAYELATRRIPRWTLEGLDLSSWRVAINAGETVIPATLRRFRERFEPFGFRPEALTPAYGLSENSVALSISPIAREAIERRGFCSVGAPLAGHEVRIVDQHGQDLPDDTPGHLLFRGPSRSPGYFHSNRLAAPAPFGEWLDSGDVAFRFEGELYIVGRAKDVIVREGRSIAPEPVENAVAQVSGAKPHGVAVIGVPDADSGTEKIVVVAEAAAEPGLPSRRAAEAIRLAVSDALGFAPDDVRLIPPGTLPLTSNGKVRRHAVRDLLIAGRLGREPAAGPVQLGGLWWANGAALLGRSVRRRVRSAREAFRWAAASAVAAAYRLPGRPEAARRGAAAVLSVLGRRPTPEGTQMRGAVVIVSNRSNSLDALSVVSLVEGKVALAGREALIDLPDWAAALVEPLVAETPEAMEAALRDGRTLVVFPDSPLGTPVPRCRYRLPAFEAARRLGCPLLPFGMQIIRNKLFFRVGERIDSAGRAPGELRAQVRGAIANIYA